MGLRNDFNAVRSHGTFKDICSLMGETSDFSKDTFTSMDISIQYICIKCLLHSYPGRPPVNSSGHQIQSKNTLQISIQATVLAYLAYLYSVEAVSSSQARSANSMTDKPCLEPIHKVVSKHYISPVLNSHCVPSLSKILIHSQKCAFHPLVEEIMTLSITPLLPDLLNYLKCQDNASPACFHYGTSFFSLNYVQIHWFPSTGSNGTLPEINTNLLIQ